MVNRQSRHPLLDPGQLDHHVRDMTATFHAEMTLAEANRRLLEAGQWLPLDGDPALSLGTLLLRNSTGPLRLGFGGWRDLLLGVQFLDGRGRLVSVGGRVVKNVAGYDVGKFLVGSFGCFGTPITITTRTYRRPSGALAVETRPGQTRVNPLLTSPLKPHGTIRTRSSDRLIYFGDEPALAFYRRELPRLDGTIRQLDLDAEARERSEAWRWATRPHSFRVAVPPARIDEFLAALPHDDWSADIAFGVIVGRCQDESMIRSSAKETGGTSVCFDENHHPVPVATSREQLNVLRELKRRLDPDGVLPALPAIAAEEP